MSSSSLEIENQVRWKIYFIVLSFNVSVTSKIARTTWGIQERCQHPHRRIHAIGWRSLPYASPFEAFCEVKLLCKVYREVGRPAADKPGIDHLTEFKTALFFKFISGLMTIILPKALLRRASVGGDGEAWPPTDEALLPAAGDYVAVRVTESLSANTLRAEPLAHASIAQFAEQFAARSERVSS